MIKVHHLNNSRSQRILWALEELGVDYEIIHYQRDAETRLAPESLKEIHPLGKSPVLEDGDVKIAESGAIIDYLVRTYGGGKFAVAQDDASYNQYVEWLHYAEGSAMLPLLLGLYSSMLGDAAAPLLPRIQSEFANHFGYLNASLGDKQFFMGDMLTGADFMLSFPMEAVTAKGAIAMFPNLAAYMKRIEERDAYKRALERGGPYQLGG